MVLVTSAAWVTLIFAAFEFVATRYPDKCPPIAGFYPKWSPSTLPPVEPPAGPGQKRRSYAQAVAEIVFGFLFLGWFVLVPQNPYLMFGPGAAYFKASPFELADVWMTFFWWVVALNLVQLLWRSIDLWRGAWRQTGHLQHIAFKILAITPLVIMLNVPDRAYVLLRHPALDQAACGATLASINNGIHLSLLVICAITVLQLAWDISQALLALYRKREAAR
jgi:hypothetical protein